MLIGVVKVLLFSVRPRRFLSQCLGKGVTVVRFCGLSLDVNLPKSLTEPVGAKAPAFSTDALSQTISRKHGQGFALLCLAQAYPVPMFRYGCRKMF